MTTTISKPEDLDLEREALVRTIDRLTGELHNCRQKLQALNRQEQKREHESTSGAAPGPCELASLGITLDT